MKLKNRPIRSRKPFKFSTPLYFGGALLAIIILIVSFNIDFNPVGIEVDVMPDRSHVPEGTDPGPYNTNPPSSGAHYANHFSSEFFNENSYEFPEGYLVHNLEHGYAIFWYNCELMNAEECSSLKHEIQGVMEKANMYKVIAYPWSKIDMPVVITSWGRMLGMEKFDPGTALTFVKKYREKSPEPQGD